MSDDKWDDPDRIRRIVEEEHRKQFGPDAQMLDLDAYRKRRQEEGTWPEDPEKYREWWRDYIRRRKTHLKIK